MSVKIIIPEFGQRECTQNCLSSIDAQQDIIVDEIVIGNDGYKESQFDLSCRTSLRIIDWSDNILFGANVNRTAGVAFGDGVRNDDIIIVANNDLIFNKDCISELCNTVLSRRGLHAPLITNASYWPQDITNSEPGDYYTDCRSFSGCCMAMLAHDWFELGGFDCDFFKSYFEEHDFCIRARLYNLPVGFTHRAKVDHTGGQTYRPLENKDLCSKLFSESRSNYLNKWGVIVWDKDDEGQWCIPSISDQDPRIKYRGINYSNFKNN